MDRWIAAIGDQPNLPEAELIKQLWNGASEQPVTQEPGIWIGNNKMTIICETDGASIGYKIKEASGWPTSWAIYTDPIDSPAGDSLKVIAHRIGYKPSDVVNTVGM